MLLAGDDGNDYETRPTTSLARDLAEAEPASSASAPSPEVSGQSARPRRHPNSDDRPARPAPQSHDRPLRPAAHSWGAGPPPNPDDRPLRPAAQSWGAGSPSRLADRAAAGANGAPARVVADRPLPGFSSASLSSTTAARSRASTGGGGYASRASGLSSETRRASTGSGGYVGARAGLAGRPRPLGQAQGGKPYEPADVLINMGYDEDTARIAVVAANGDIDRALRIMLEDAKAHSARQEGEWEFEGDKGWAAFDCDTDQQLHEAFVKGDSACELRVAGHRYLVDFDSFTQLNLSSQRTRRIRRRGPDASRSSTDPPPASKATSSAVAAPVVHERVAARRPPPDADAARSSSSNPGVQDVGASV